MVLSARSAFAGAVAGLALFASACAPAGGGMIPGAYTPSGDHQIWGVGDSQAAPAGLPGRGAGWGERLRIGDGWGLMYGAGWISPSSFTGETFGQRIATIAQVESAETVIVMGGANDLYYYTADQVRPQVIASDAASSAAGLEVIYVTLPPFPIYSPLQANEAQREAVNANVLADFPDRSIDCEHALVNGAGNLRAEYAMAPDDLHLNDAGEQAFVNCVAAHPLLAGRVPVA